MPDISENPPNGAQDSRKPPVPSSHTTGPAAVGGDRWVFLDRDGVLNQDSTAYIKNPDEWIPITPAIHAAARLSQAGYQLAIATNQSGLARGYFSANILEAIHQKLQIHIQAAGGHIAGIFVCPHLPDAGCSCRKPLPGLLHQIQAHFAIPPAIFARAVMVGDTKKDIQAALSAGCRAYWVESGHPLTAADRAWAQEHQIPIVPDLSAVSTVLLATAAYPDPAVR